MQSPPLRPTFSPYHVVRYVWDLWTGTQIVVVDTAHSRLLLRNFSAPVFELWGTPSICDKLTTWLILWFISKKLCSSLKTFGKTCKKPAATWLDFWAPLLSLVSRSLTLFLFFLLDCWSYFELISSSNNIFCAYIQFSLVFSLTLRQQNQPKCTQCPRPAKTCTLSSYGPFPNYRLNRTFHTPRGEEKLLTN